MISVFTKYCKREGLKKCFTFFFTSIFKGRWLELRNVIDTAESVRNVIDTAESDSAES